MGYGWNPSLGTISCSTYHHTPTYQICNKASPAPRASKFRGSVLHYQLEHLSEIVSMRTETDLIYPPFLLTCGPKSLLTVKNHSLASPGLIQDIGIEVRTRCVVKVIRTALCAKINMPICSGLGSCGLHLESILKY